MKFHAKLEQFEKELAHKQMSKITLKNKAERLVAEAEKRVDQAKDPKVSYEAMGHLHTARKLQRAVG